MTLPLTARKDAADQPCRRSLEPVMTFTGEGLALGGAILAPLHHDRTGCRRFVPRGRSWRAWARD